MQRRELPEAGSQPAGDNVCGSPRAPHNRSPGPRTAPRAEQRVARRAPHSEQKRCPGRFSWSPAQRVLTGFSGRHTASRQLSYGHPPGVNANGGFTVREESSIRRAVNRSWLEGVPADLIYSILRHEGASAFPTAQSGRPRGKRVSRVARRLGCGSYQG